MRIIQEMDFVTVLQFKAELVFGRVDVVSVLMQMRMMHSQSFQVGFNNGFEQS
jgi:hypothetical protein